MKCKRAMLCLAAAVISAAVLSAQTQPPTRNPNALIASGEPAKAILQSTAKRAEERLVPMVLQRNELSGDARVRLEALLDMEVLIRWASALKPGTDDYAAVVYIRLGQLNSAASGLRERFAEAPDAKLNNIQQNAARQLHQITFELPANVDAAKLDEVCRSVGMYALELATGEVTNPSKVPAMRPGSLPPAPADAVQPMAPRPMGASRSEPSRLIPHLTVSQPLRQQLIATLDMVERPAQHNLSEQDVAQLRPVLHEAIDIASGLASNAGVTADERMQLEQQLTESLALFSDRRLQDLGKQRIAEMSQYRQVLGSITRLQLTEGNYKLLAPAFEYAQKTPDASKQVLAAIERFVGYCTLYDKSPTVVSYAANPALAKSIERPYQESRKAFELSRSEFIGAAEGLGAGPISGTEPADLDVRLEEMRIALDLIDALQAMPEALDTLGTYNAKPISGLDRRIAREAAIAATPGKGPVRQEATNVLKCLVRLAETARELEKLKIEGQELAIFTAYTKKTPEAIQAKWRSNVTEVITQAATGAPIDVQRMERNESLAMLVRSLTDIAQVEATLKQSPALERWADWGIDPQAAQQVLLPYRSSATGAFTGFLNDNTEPMRAWPDVQKEQRPIIRFMLRSVLGASTLPEVPSPMHSTCAKLMTPLATGAYATHRYFSLANAVLPAAGQADAQQIRKALATRIGRE